MITKKKWKKQYLKAVLREKPPWNLNVRGFIEKMAAQYYGILTPGELIEEYRELIEDGLIPINN